MLVQVYLVDTKGCNISNWVHLNRAEWLVSGKQGCHTVTLRLVQVMLLRQLCVWNQWREEGRMQRQAGTRPRNVITAWDDRKALSIFGLKSYNFGACIWTCSVTTPLLQPLIAIRKDSFCYLWSASWGVFSLQRRGEHSSTPNLAAPSK